MMISGKGHFNSTGLTSDNVYAFWRNIPKLPWVIMNDPLVTISVISTKLKGKKVPEGVFYHVSRRHLVTLWWHLAFPPRVGEHVLEHFDAIMWNIHRGSQERCLFERGCQQGHWKAMQCVT